MLPKVEVKCREAYATAAAAPSAGGSAKASLFAPDAPDASPTTGAEVALSGDSDPMRALCAAERERLEADADWQPFYAQLPWLDVWLPQVPTRTAAFAQSQHRGARALLPFFPFFLILFLLFFLVFLLLFFLLFHLPSTLPFLLLPSPPSGQCLAAPFGLRSSLRPRRSWALLRLMPTRIRAGRCRC